MLKIIRSIEYMDLKPYSLSHGAHKMRKDPDTDISGTFQRKRILQPLGSGFGAIPGFQSRNALDIFAYLLLRLENRWASATSYQWIAGSKLPPRRHVARPLQPSRPRMQDSTQKPLAVLQSGFASLKHATLNPKLLQP